MKIAVLTSSRADYGIYLPLLNELKNDLFFNLEIIAFGTHLSKKHGFTISEINKDGYKSIHEINSLVDDDSEKGIVDSYARTILLFSEFWNINKYDLVVCLGDRFEMSAAVQASIPYGVKLAHIHGGEITLGAIDNIYRHQITLASKFHFVSNSENRIKVEQITGSKDFIYNIGSLSLSEVEKFNPTEKDFFLKNSGINQVPYILVTFHPETISVEKNYVFAKEAIDALSILCEKINLVITMPNADTLGSVFRNEIKLLKSRNPDKVLLIENFGKINYFNAMFYSSLIIGNSSSGIIEAASFYKYVLNIGDRQKGRAQSKNVYNTSFNSTKIAQLAFKLINMKPFRGKNIYHKENSNKKMIKILKKIKWQ